MEKHASPSSSGEDHLALHAVAQLELMAQPVGLRCRRAACKAHRPGGWRKLSGRHLGDICRRRHMSLERPTYVSGHRHKSTQIDIHRQRHVSVPTNTCRIGHGRGRPRKKAAASKTQATSLWNTSSFFLSAAFGIEVMVLWCPPRPTPATLRVRPDAPTRFHRAVQPERVLITTIYLSQKGGNIT